jgi:hypothetical protein
MHGSLHLILADVSNRNRQAQAREARLAASVRGPFTSLAARLAAAHGLPPRGAPGTDAPSLGHRTAASLRGR